MGSTKLVIVAVPQDRDPVWKISSEKVPHMTLLYLGEAETPQDQIDLAVQYVAHASTKFHRFSMDVIKRGTLGDDKADVLFFDKKWARDVIQFRDMLMQDPVISARYNSIEQYPEWTPHLTLGYPKTPAKNSSIEHDPYSVTFDKIEVWTNDYAGYSFELEPYSYDDGMEVAMSDLKHYGVKGMKWGVRRSDAQLARASDSRPVLSEDAKKASSLGSKIQTHGTSALSNQEMRQYLERMDLERRFQQSVGDVRQQAAVDRGLANAEKLLRIGGTVEKARKFLQTPTGQAVKKGFVAAATAGAAYATGGATAAAGAGASVVLRNRQRNHYTNVGN